MILPAPPRFRRPGRLLAAALLTVVAIAGCDTAEPALRVDGVGYEEEEVIAYGPPSRRALAAITAVGVAVSAEDTLHPGRPLIEVRRMEALVRRLREEALLEAADVDDEVLRLHYRSNPEHELTVRHAVFLSERSEEEERRADARRRAERALERIRSGEPFGRVAAELSEEPGAQRREGLLQPGREGTWVDEFWRAASALEPGGVSDVVETRYGYHVLRLEDRDTVSFEEARPRVVAEVASLLPPDPSAMAALEDSVVGPVVVDRERLGRWLEEWDPWEDEAGEEWSCPAEPAEGEPAWEWPWEADAPAAAVDAPPVATWPDGAITHCHLRRYLATLPYGRWREVTGSIDALAAETEELARSVALARTSRARGLEAPRAEVEEARREWAERLRRWAAVLGFQPGMPPDGVKSTALEALGSAGQEGRIVRDEIRERIPLLLHAYPVRFGSGEADEG